METILASRTLLESLRLIVIFSCAFLVGLVTCKGRAQKKSSSDGKEKGKKTKKTETDEDVKIDLNIKPADQKRDEFDDDEENPLAKIPTKSRIPKQQKNLGASTSRTSSKIEPEASFFAPHEKTTNASCYMVRTANNG